LDRIRADLLDSDRLVRAVAAGRRRSERPDLRRAELRWVDLRDGCRLQVVTHDERQAFTRNVTPDRAAATVDDLLGQPYGNWRVDTTEATVQLRVTKRGEAQVHRTPAVASPGPGRLHDQVKRRLLDPADPFLRAVASATSRAGSKPAAGTSTARSRSSCERWSRFSTGPARRRGRSRCASPTSAAATRI
jgi:hypothetical protein